MHLPDAFKELDGMLKAKFISSRWQFAPRRPDILYLSLGAPEVVSPDRKINEDDFIGQREPIFNDIERAIAINNPKRLTFNCFKSSNCICVWANF